MFREIFRIWIEFTTPNTHVKDSTNQDTPEVHATISQHLNVLMAAKKDFEKQNDLIRMALTLGTNFPKTNDNNFLPFMF